MRSTRFEVHEIQGTELFTGHHAKKGRAECGDWKHKLCERMILGAHCEVCKALVTCLPPVQVLNASTALADPARGLQRPWDRTHVATRPSCAGTTVPSFRRVQLRQSCADNACEHKPELFANEHRIKNRTRNTRSTVVTEAQTAPRFCKC